MNTLAPLFRHSVGFDRFDDWLETALRSDQSNGYPPYDIIRESDGTYRVVMAVAVAAWCGAEAAKAWAVPVDEGLETRAPPPRAAKRRACTSAETC